ncbi:MAG: GIY-YIG nuclease family protein [Patescibacteria group bacterium]|nr:GIY-YIG nuclease family protein [Patescibacteria group bacterium]
MPGRIYYVYLMVNKTNTVVYTGVTNNLRRRVFEHKNKLVKGFTSKYNVNKLVYFEETEDVSTAIFREKQIKGWLRIKKIKLIQTRNQGFKDLSEYWYD